jgi:hypothetical protein
VRREVSDALLLAMLLQLLQLIRFLRLGEDIMFPKYVSGSCFMFRQDLFSL